VKCADTLSLEIHNILFEIKWCLTISPIGHFVNASVHKTKYNLKDFNQTKNAWKIKLGLLTLEFSITPIHFH
jgi:hypothetical protein